MIILYLILKYTLEWIKYFNSLDSRLGQSTWRWSYDYPVMGERDISDLDDRDFVRLRRKRNKIITIMYSIVLIMFIASNSFLALAVILILTSPRFAYGATVGFFNFKRFLIFSEMVDSPIPENFSVLEKNT